MAVQLSGPGAFCRDCEYPRHLVEEFVDRVSLPIAYRYSEPESVCRGFMRPYQALQDAVGAMVVRSIGKKLIQSPSLESDVWKYKRIRVSCNGQDIDGAIIGSEQSFARKRWVLFSQGNSGLYEEALGTGVYERWLKLLGANGLIFNYPGVSLSQGPTTKRSCARAHRAMLSFLESQVKAQEIICHGFSLGGVIQGESLRFHRFKQEVAYAVVYDRTFASLSALVSSLGDSSLWGRAVSLFDWNAIYEPTDKPELVIQSSDIESGAVLLTSDRLLADDGVIPKADSLAKRVLGYPEERRANIQVIGVAEGHFARLSADRVIAEYILGLLARERLGRAA